jgi:hypothetical protein
MFSACIINNIPDVFFVPGRAGETMKKISCLKQEVLNGIVYANMRLD